MTSQGMTTHLHTKAPGGRFVSLPDGTLMASWPDTPTGKRGFLAITADLRGAWAVRTTNKEAAIDVCDRLGLNKSSIIGGEFSG